MNNIPFLDLPPEYSWGTKYEVLLDRFITTGAVFYQVKGNVFNSYNVIGIEAEWESIRFKAYLFFSRFLKCLHKCTIVIPHNITRWDATDFINTFNILFSKFGTPAIANGMTIEELREHKNYQAVRPDALPHFEWQFDCCVLKHRFIDYCGNGPSTTMEPRSKSDRT